MELIIRDILEEKRTALKRKLGEAEVDRARHAFHLNRANVSIEKLRAAIIAIEEELRRSDIEEELQRDA